MTIINEKTIVVYDYAFGGRWNNPVGGTPSISVEVCQVTDRTVDDKIVTEQVSYTGRDNKAIPFTPEKEIDPSKYGMEGLPVITHEMFYSYFKTMTLDAMKGE